jgi:hypothetical protein
LVFASGIIDQPNEGGTSVSIFNFPRINFKGTIQLSPGTANNDDYAQQPFLVFPPGGPNAGRPLALIDSKMVRPLTYGMSDTDFITWAQMGQPFINTANQKQVQVIPAEWNYYGGMDSRTLNSTTIIGVQTAPGQIFTEANPSDPATEILGAVVSCSGHITDVNSEGSPPATQFFVDSLTVTKAAKTFLSGTASKGACQWLNFYRNVNLAADGGSGGYVYHVMRKGDPGAIIQIPGFDDPGIVGAICRYYLYRRSGGASSNRDIEQLYKHRATNPALLEIVGTFAPLYAGERILTGPAGRLLTSDETMIPTPSDSQNNGERKGDRTYVALAPTVLHRSANIITVDFAGTFPDYFDQASGANPKFDFGPVSLTAINDGESAVIGPVDYANTELGDCRGWIFDFDISSNTAAKRVLGDHDARFDLQHPQYGNVLSETDYYFVSNQQAIYAEQYGPDDLFLNQGTTEPVNLSVYHRGRELIGADCPPITVWQYRSVPIQSPGDVDKIATNFKPAQPLRVDTSQPGNFLFTFSIGANPKGFPPRNYNTYMQPPYVTNAPSISLRILPNDEDFSQYYLDPKAKEPVGNDKLTFDIVYEKVLRTYYLLYPAMNDIFPLNSEAAVRASALAILAATDPKIWMMGAYMPRTRDLSESRRKLLRAWCHKVAPGVM